MKTNTMKIPYVSLVRLSLEEINGYKLNPETNSYKSGLEEFNEKEGYDTNVKSIDSPYVLIERLSPHVIQSLLVKKN